MKAEWPPEKQNPSDRKAEIRKELDALNAKERVTSAGSKNHDRHEADVLARENELRGIENAERIAEIKKRLAGLEKEAAQPRAGVLERVEPQILKLEEEIRTLEQGATTPPKMATRKEQLAELIDAAKKLEATTATPEPTQEVAPEAQPGEVAAETAPTAQPEKAAAPKTLTPDAKKFADFNGADKFTISTPEAPKTNAQKFADFNGADKFSITKPEGAADYALTVPNKKEEPAPAKKAESAPYVDADVMAKINKRMPKLVFQGPNPGGTEKAAEADKKDSSEANGTGSAPGGPAKKGTEKPKRNLFAWLGGGTLAAGALAFLFGTQPDKPETNAKTENELKNKPKPPVTSTAQTTSGAGNQEVNPSAADQARASKGTSAAPGVTVVPGADGAPAKVIVERSAEATRTTSAPEMPVIPDMGEAERTEWAKQFNIWMLNHYPKGYVKEDAPKVRVEMLYGVERVRGKAYPIDPEVRKGMEREAEARMAAPKPQKEVKPAPRPAPPPVVEKKQPVAPAPASTPAPRVVEQPPAPPERAPVAPRPATDEAFAGTAYEVDPNESHLYTIDDKDEPGGKIYVLYGGGDTRDPEFVKKIDAVAREHPGIPIYFNSGYGNVNYAKFDGVIVKTELTPKDGTLMGMELNPSMFSGKVG